MIEESDMAALLTPGVMFEALDGAAEIISELDLAIRRTATIMPRNEDLAFICGSLSAVLASLNDLRNWVSHSYRDVARVR